MSAGRALYDTASEIHGEAIDANRRGRAAEAEFLRGVGLVARRWADAEAWEAEAMATTARATCESGSLRIDVDDRVWLCLPGGTSTPLGHVADTRTNRACPEGLRGDLSRLYDGYVRGLRMTPVPVEAS